MNKSILITVAVIALILVGGGVYLSLQSSDEASSRQTQSPTKPEAMMEEDKDAIMGNSEEKMSDNKMMDSSLWAGEGAYKDYSAEAVRSESEQARKIVLFFHAPWCPFCKTANTAFLEKTDQIPDGVTVFKTDYDSNTELKKKYGVTYQHTFVQIDQNGEMITKWNGGDIDSLIKNLK